MSDNLKLFMAENVIPQSNTKYVASQRFLDENGKPLEWELKVIPNEEMEIIRKRCQRKSFVAGTRETRVETDYEKVNDELVLSSVVYPNLNDKALQDSWKSIGALECVKAMLTPGEYQDLQLAVQETCGYKAGLEDKIKRAKN